jgi:hypothetical protein
MLWVENNHNHRFQASDLSEDLQLYARSEGLVLDDSAKKSPVRQIHRHFSNKGRETQRAQGFPNLSSSLETQRAQGFPASAKGLDSQREQGFPALVRGRETQRALGFPALARGLETQRAQGFPALARGRETQRAQGYPALEVQRALGFPSLVKATETQRINRLADIERQRLERIADADSDHATRGSVLSDTALQWPKLKPGKINRIATDWNLRTMQENIDATLKRKREDPAFAASLLPPPRKQRKLETESRVKKTFGSQSCKQCGKEFDSQSRLDIHMVTHAAARDFPCAFPGCGQSFKQKANADTHYDNVHAKKGQTRCDICSKTFSTKPNMLRHRKKEHPKAAPYA